MNSEGYIICIDDDRTHNMLCTFMLRDTFKKAIIKTFDQPDEAISFLSSDEFLKSSTPKVIFLDINMPGLSGWDVLQNLEHLKNQQEDIAIHMLSSSIDDQDKERANANSLVRGYIDKPMSLETVQEMSLWLNEPKV